MKPSKINIGDLVCFNSAGQKHKTLGLVIELKSASGSLFSSLQDFVLIQWCIVGEFMPRKNTPPYCNIKTQWDDIQSGDYVWHSMGDYFEVVT